MKADTLTLKALFQKEVRYLIPTFQRPYVWTQEDQWEGLWDDLRNAAEWYLEELERAEGNNAAAEERARKHFMGAVVLQQQPTPTAEIETRTVIDGQQRLTTMQLLLDAAQEVTEERGLAEATRLERLVVNQFAKGDERFKLWPASLDQDAFRASMTNGSPVPEALGDSLIVQGHDFFRLQIAEWLDAADDQDGEKLRAHGLETALFALLVLVVIDLSTVDDPFVIFETLNARGTPLLASDLVKNYVLQRASMVGFPSDELYANDWKQFEESWWRTEVAQGRLYRPRIDVFLNYWLIMRTAADVPTSDVFPKFKEYAEQNGSPIDAIARDLHIVGDAYSKFDAFDPWSVIGTFFYRWRTIEAGVTTPILLWLFSQESIEMARLERSLRAIESFLVRRMVCRMTAKNYNELFLELLSRFDSGGPDSVDATVVTYLAEQTADSRLWPSDAAFRDALLELPLYRLLTRGRLRMVLEALEDATRTAFAEEQHVQRGKLTIEHVLPRSWHEYWPLSYSENDLELAAVRDRSLHTIGNLTLVNEKLNPALSNREWETKQQLLSAHTVLYLNKELLDGWADRPWDEDSIRVRGDRLATRAESIWPSSAKFLEQI